MIGTITYHNIKNHQASKYRYDNDIQKVMRVRIVNTDMTMIYRR